MIVGDNGTELTSHAIFSCAKDQRIESHDIMPGKPMQHSYVESFNGKMWQGLLKETLVFSIDQAREAIAKWIEDYNTERPHSSLAHETPAACAAGVRYNRPARNSPPRLRMSPCCSTHSTGHTPGYGSKSCWMKVQWRVTCPTVHLCFLL